MAHKIASVTFIHYNMKSYDFFTDIEDLKAGDTVVVDTQNGLQLAKVDMVYTEKTPGRATKWVVAKVDLSAHEARLEREKKAAELRKKLEARRKKLEEIAVYRMLAEQDPEMAEILKEYEEVVGQ
jgi:predicted GTPase